MSTGRRPPKARRQAESLAPSELLPYPHDFVPRGDAVADLHPAVFAQVAHAVAARGFGEYAGVRVAHDELAHVVVQVHHLEDPDARRVARAIARRATRAAERLDGFALG